MGADLDDLLREMMEHRRLTTQISLDMAKLAEVAIHQSKQSRLLIYALIGIAAGTKLLEFVVPIS